MEDLDTFLTLLYIMVDDLCKWHQLQYPARRGPAPKLAWSELITLALFEQGPIFQRESLVSLRLTSPASNLSDLA